MAANNAFTLKGATPAQTYKPIVTGGSTPQANALNRVASGPGSFMKPQTPTVQAPSPSTPLKKTTTNNTDGSSIVHEYHAPTTSGLINPKASYSGGESVPVPGTPEYTQAQNMAQSTSPGMIPSASTPEPKMNSNQTAVKGLLDVGTKGSAEVNKAAEDLKNYKIANANTLAAIQGDPNKSLDTKTGLGRIVSDRTAQVLPALETAVSNALSGQGQGISALSSAASATAPVQVPYGTQFGSPQDLAAANAGGTGSGGALNPLNNVSSIAQQVVQGQISPSQAYAMGGNVQNWQGLLNAEIQKAQPGFNTATAQGRYEANQSNTTTAGTAPTSAAADVYGKTYGQLLDLKNTTQNVDQFGNLLLSTMKDTNGNQINPSNVKFANLTLSAIRDQLSSAQQAAFDSTYAALKSRISGLLAMGGSEIPTQITADANKVLDGSLPLTSLTAVLNRISTEGNILTSNLEQKLNSAGGVIGAPQSGQNSNPLGI